MLGKLDKMHREGNLPESSILDKIKALFYLEAARVTESKLVKLQRMGSLIWGHLFAYQFLSFLKACRQGGPQCSCF